MSGNVFVAVDLREEERYALAAALRDASPGPVIPGRRVPPENWHITLRFIGEVEELIVERLAHELGEHLEPATGTVRFRGLGAFPNAKKATVVYVSIDDAEGVLAHLAAECEDACRAVGLEPEGRPFVPHLTIARVRPPVDVRRLIDRFGDFSVPLGVDEIRLMRSELVKGGVRYDVLDALPLGEDGR
jgi:2'-5' RNA ligase